MTPTPSGLYDAETKALQQGFRSDAALILILGGDRGSGCSIMCKPQLQPHIPAQLRVIADQMERDMVMKRTLDLGDKEKGDN